MQIGQQVFDFFALIKLLPLNNLVRHQVRLQSMLKASGKGIHSIENCEVAGFSFFVFNLPGDGLCNGIGLLALGGIGD